MRSHDVPLLLQQAEGFGSSAGTTRGRQNSAAAQMQMQDAIA
jgi:hypothetical protein